MKVIELRAELQARNLDTKGECLETRKIEIPETIFTAL